MQINAAFFNPRYKRNENSISQEEKNVLAMCSIVPEHFGSYSVAVI